MTGLIVSRNLPDVADIIVENYVNESEEEKQQEAEEEQVDLGWEEPQPVKKRKSKAVELTKEEFDEEAAVEEARVRSYIYNIYIYMSSANNSIQGISSTTSFRSFSPPEPAQTFASSRI